MYGIHRVILTTLSPMGERVVKITLGPNVLVYGVGL